MKWKIILLAGYWLGLFGSDATAQWSTSGSDIYYNSGNVGIGTTNPESNLDITPGSGGGKINLGRNGACDHCSVGIITFDRKSTPEDVFTGTLALIMGRGDPDNSNGGSLDFRTSNDDGTSMPTRMLINSEGNVGIGTTTPTARLTVAGTAKAEEVIVTENVGADFVFEEDYALPDLSELEAFLKANKHLPEVPSAEEMIQNGVKMGELQMKLLQKIEELTLYTIEQQKLLTRQQQLLKKQQKEIEQLKTEL